MHRHLIQLNGHDTALYEAGSAGAEPLLFLHGFPEYGGAWEEMFNELSPRYHCIAFDQRGFGTSWHPDKVGDYAGGKLVGDVVAVLDHLDLKTVTLVGHDWGAAVAYAAAFMAADRICRLIILNGVHPIPFQRALAAGGPQSEASQYINWLRQNGVEDILAKDNFAKLRGLFAAHMDMGWLNGARLQTYLEVWRNARHIRGAVNWYRASPVQVARPDEPIALPDWTQHPMRIQQPHLLIWGMNDRALLPEAYEGLEHLCDDLTVVDLPDVDHWLHHQAPARVAKTMTDWLDQNPLPLSP